MRGLVLAAVVGLIGFAAPKAQAQAEVPYIGQVVSFGFGYCPQGTVPADGRLFPTAWTELYSLYGNRFGGDRYSFAVPDLRGTRFIGQGEPPSIYAMPNPYLGQRMGSETTRLTLAQLTQHSHVFNGSSAAATNDAPAGGTFATFTGVNVYAEAGSNDVQMNALTVAPNGRGQPFDVRSPYLAVNYCIVTDGLYPDRL